MGDFDESSQWLTAANIQANEYVDDFAAGWRIGSDRVLRFYSPINRLATQPTTARIGTKSNHAICTRR